MALALRFREPAGASPGPDFAGPYWPWAILADRCTVDGTACDRGAVVHYDYISDFKAAIAGA